MDLPEALEVYPNDGPRSLTIVEYRARQQKRTKPKKKRSGKRNKLLRQRMLAKELIKTAPTPGEAAVHKTELAKIKSHLRTGAI